MSENSVTNLTTDVEILGTIKFEKIMNIDGKFVGELIAEHGELIVGKTAFPTALHSLLSQYVRGSVPD